MQPIKNRTGEKYITSEGYTIKILKCTSNKDCSIVFDNGIVLNNREFADIKKGYIKNHMHKSVFGVGYIGLGGFTSKNNRKAYSIWKAILERIYHKPLIAYSDCSVDERWFNFQVFAKWFEENYIEGFQLDKDILFKGNKKYSDTTCCFVPSEINLLFTKCDRKRSKYHIGISKYFNKYRSNCRIDGINTFLGLYHTPEEAFLSYKNAKEENIRFLAEKWKNKITNNTYNAMINYIVEITD